MKKLKKLFVALALCAPLTAMAKDVVINEENFPDANFRTYLQEQWYGEDGVITEAEIKGITSIFVDRRGISSLKGIEHFTALRWLYCLDNQLTALDVSKNTALTELRCQNNQLTALDVSNNTALTTLRCYSNQLTALDVSKNTELTWLDCLDNQLTALDVSKNTALTDLDCGGNQLTALDVSKNTELTWLDCSSNQLTVLDVSKNTALTGLVCRYNELTALDVSNNTELTSLSCYNNKLTALDVSNNTELTSLYCANNQLTALDMSKNTELTWLACYYNQLTALDVSKNTALTDLSCYNNQLTALDVSKNTELTNLVCWGNDLTALDVSNNTALTRLDCYGNQLTALDVSSNTALTTLNCYDNQLTALDVSKNTALTELYCYQNQIKGESMDALVSSLPETGGTLRVRYWVSEGNVMTKAQVAAAKAKGWTPYYHDWDSWKWLEYEGGIPESVTVTIGEDGLATFCPEYDVDFSSATTIAAYKAAVSGNTVKLTRVETVAAGEGVLIRSLSGDAVEEELPTIDAETAMNADNAFVGTLTGITLPATENGVTNFVLSKVNGVIGFFKADNTAVAAGKAYLPVENYNAARGLSIVFDDGTTGISEITSKQTADDAAVYTLGGVRTAKPTKGLYIKNGKKVFIK